LQMFDDHIAISSSSSSRSSSIQLLLCFCSYTHRGARPKLRSEARRTDGRDEATGLSPRGTGTDRLSVDVVLVALIRETSSPAGARPTVR